MSDKQPPKATNLYVTDPWTAISVYTFDAKAGKVDVRVNGNTVQCGFELPADKARALGLALIEHADFSDASAAQEAV